MAKMLLTVKLDVDGPTVADVCRHLGISDRDIDPTFGVVLIDPEDQRYAVMVDEAVVETATRARDVAGPFSNPRIEPFGVPQRAARPPESEPASTDDMQSDERRGDHRTE